MTAVQGQPRMPRILSIAGSDSGGGAGIQADIKTITALGGYAATAVTAVTVQNTCGVYGIHAIPPDVIRAQIRMVLDDIGADAIKIGMLGDKATVLAVVDGLVDVGYGGPIVLDPVMVATSGDTLTDGDAIDAIIGLLIPRVRLITPNLPEAAVLLDRPVEDPASDAAALARQFDCAVLLKGGHGDGDMITDWLAMRSEYREYSQPRIETRSTHGTGCTLSSAVATGLGAGLGMAEAVEQGIAYVRRAIHAAPGFGGGHGPLGHARAGTGYGG